MKLKTKIKSGGTSLNHNQSLRQASASEAGRAAPGRAVRLFVCQLR
jgi:hypothetical protein